MASFKREIAIVSDEPPQRSLFGTTVDGIVEENAMSFKIVGANFEEDSDPELNEIKAFNYNEVFLGETSTEDLASVHGDIDFPDPYMFDE